MDWLHHPRFERIRAGVLHAFQRKEFYFRRIDKVLFLCGGKDSPRRDDIAEYIRRHMRDVLTFYAESVWSVIAAHSATRNALDVEADLASLADLVLVVVESPGTFAELGAFASSEPLRRKLLPILDKEHRTAQSFIVTGPVRWVDSDSAFGPTLWVDFRRVLESADQIEERIRRIPDGKGAKIDDLSTSPKHIVFFVCDLVAVFGPCPAGHVSAAIGQVLGKRGAKVDASFFLGLGKALGLLRSFQYDGHEVFYRPLVDGRLPSFQRRRHNLDLPTLRAEVLSAMLAIPACVSLLEAMGREA